MLAAHGAYVFPKVNDIVDLEETTWKAEWRVNNVEPLTKQEIEQFERTHGVPEMKFSPGAHIPGESAKSKPQEEIDEEIESLMPEAPVLGTTPKDRQRAKVKTGKKVSVKKG